MDDNKKQRRDDMRATGPLQWDEAVGEFEGYVDGDPLVKWLDLSKMPRVGGKLYTRPYAEEAGQLPGLPVKTWRQRIGQGADYPLHAPTDVERAMVAEIAERCAANQASAGEILTLHRQLAAEKLRADQGCTRAEAKSRECIELRERMAATGTSSAEPTVDRAAVLAEALALLPTIMADTFKCDDSSEEFLNGMARGVASYGAAIKQLGAAKVPSTDKLLTIIAAAYQVAGAHAVPARILDVLARPEDATGEQVAAMLPYVAQVDLDADRYSWLTSGWTPEELADDHAHGRQPADKPQLTVINQLALWYLAKDQVDTLVDAAMAIHGMQVEPASAGQPETRRSSEKLQVERHRSEASGALSRQQSEVSDVELRHESEVIDASARPASEVRAAKARPQTGTCAAFSRHQAEWSDDLQRRLIDLCKDQDADVACILGEAACLLADLTGRPSAKEAEHG